MSITKHPENTRWKSLKYRRWLRRWGVCPFCYRSLLDHKESYQGHHHGHEGGKNPSDQLIVQACDQCHSAFHLNESTFNRRYEMTDEKWLEICIQSLSAYVEAHNVNLQYVMINALQKAAEEL